MSLHLDDKDNSQTICANYQMVPSQLHHNANTYKQSINIISANDLTLAIKQQDNSPLLSPISAQTWTLLKYLNGIFTDCNKVNTTPKQQPSHPTVPSLEIGDPTQNALLKVAEALIEPLSPTAIVITTATQT